MIDISIFTGGLKEAGKFLRTFCGHNVYGICHYSDLYPILGDKWHLRVLNKQMDFCYAKLETHLHCRQLLPDFIPDQTQQFVEGSYVLVFQFVRVDGV